MAPPARLLAALLAIGCALLGAGTASAQSTGILTGQVRDSAGRPLESVEILVQGLARTVLTNAAGNFRLDSVPAGPQPVTARRLGYQAVQRIVTVTAGAVTRLELVLQELPQRLAPVEVLGGRFVPTLIGYVSDGEGRPLEHVQILVNGELGSGGTNSGGVFRIDSLEAGRYQITARLPGYAAAHSQVEVSATRLTEVALRLRAFTPVLETIEVVADRRGLYGVVSTDGLKPVAGAVVRVHGGGTQQLTDSLGRFAFPGVRVGDYLVSVEADGLEARRMHLEMPRNGRLEVAIALDAENVSRRPYPGQRWVNHDLGLMLAFQPASRRMSRSELARFAGRQLCDIARIRAVARGSEATIIVDGVQALNPWSLCAFNSDEVALVQFLGGSSCMAMGVVVVPPRPLRCIGVWTR